MQKIIRIKQRMMRLSILFGVSFMLLSLFGILSWGPVSAELPLSTEASLQAASDQTRAPVTTVTYQDFESGSSAVISAWWPGTATAVNTNNTSNAHTGDWYGLITPSDNGGNGNPVFHQSDPWTTPTGFDASTYERLCAWVLDESATSGIAISAYLQNASGDQSATITLDQHTAPGEWRKLCWDMSDFTPAARHADIHRILFMTDGIPGFGGANTVSGPFRIDDIHFEDTTQTCSADEVQGTIFHDYNNNGIQDRSEPGVFNAAVSVVNVAGTTAGLTTDSDGDYSSTGTFTAGDDVRIELTLPSGYYASAAGNTSVVFSTAGTCDLDIGIYQADQYCQDNPEIATTCYVAGVYTGTNSAMDVLVSFPYASQGIAHGMNGDTPVFTPTHAANSSELGTTWGLAYQRSSETLFAGAMLKRLTDFGPLGTGGIYTLDYGANPTNPTIGQWVDIADAGGLNIATGADPRVEDGIQLSIDGATPTRDQTAYDNVGKRSLGDLELDDANTLWFVNLFDQSLYGIENADPATTPSAAIGPYSIPDQIADLECADSDVRPWGLKFYDGLLYVGVVCSAESTATATDLHAYILTFNTTTRAFTGTAFDFDLSNRYACVYWLAEPDGCTWRPWGSTELVHGTNPSGFNAILNPQPILSDIEFDVDGSMILGFMDRHGHQSGLQNYSGDPSDNNPNYTAMAGGDVVRVCNIGGTFELEEGGICANGNTEHGFGGAYSGINNAAYGRGEYYLDDENVYSDGLTHAETAAGGLALLHGSGSIVYSAMNPIDRTNSGGLRWNNNHTGLQERGVELFRGFIDPIDPNPPVFGKATGVGDIELMCALPPIEIGNRVWHDADNDGVQDPGETPLADVTVELIDTDGTTVLATAVTDANGHYYFSSATGTSTTSTIYNISGLAASTSGYQLRIPLSDTDLGGRAVSTGSSATNDLHDNDAVQSGAYAVVNFSTGAVGENNHTYDFSFSSQVQIGNRLWTENDGDGVYGNDGSDAPLIGVTVTVHDGSGNTYTAITDASGLYTVTVPSSGIYTVTVPTPIGYQQSAVLHNTDSDPNSGDNENHNSTGTVVTVDGAHNYTIDFAFTPYSDSYCVERSASGFLDISSITTSAHNGSGSFNYPNLALPGGGTVTIDVVKSGGTHNRNTSAIDAGGKQQYWQDQGYGTGQADALFIEPNSNTITVTYTFAEPAGNIDLLLLDIDEAEVLYLSAKDNTGATITNFNGWRFASGDLSTWEGSTPGNIAEPARWDSSAATITAIDDEDGAGDHRSFATLTPDVLITEFQIVFPSTGVSGRHVYSTLFATTLGRDGDSCVLIGDRVWTENDGDGIYGNDASDAAVVGSIVTATDSNGTTYTDVTNASGFYTIGVPANATYTVTVPTPATYIPSTVVFSGTDSDPISNNNESHNSAGAPVAVTTVNNLTIDFAFTPPPMCGDNATDIGGTIWRDYNANGVKDANEPGYAVAGMVVSAYGDSATPVMTTTVNTDGTYILSSLSDGSTRYRIEFTGFPSYLQPGASGAQNGTSVQFVTNATCNLDLGLNDPSDYCQSNPELATTCFVGGDPLAVGADMTNDDALVRFSNSVSGVGTPGEDEFLVATVGEIGAAWGMAYDSANDRLFVSELVKRHVGLIGNETGGVIYQITNPASTGTTVSTYLDFVTDLTIDVVDTSGSYASIPSNSARGLQANKADQSVDLQGFELAAKASFGDMDISHDGETLYVVNLGDRRVYAIDISQVDAGTKNATALPAFPDPGCTLGVARPWALEIHNGLVHLGVVCSAENGGTSANLSAHVYAYDPAANTWNTTSLIDIPLNYTKGLAYYNNPSSNRWNPWTDDFNDFTAQGGGGIFAPMLHPQPILADIEFDHENSMHLAFADRAGHQFGHRNAAPIGGNQGTGMTGGDLIRTYYDQSTGQYTYEINASVGPYTSAGANNGEGRCDGANCGEFYFDDYVGTAAQPLGYHRETHSSGLAHIIGTTELPAITMDPIYNRLDAQGVHWYDITTGAAIRDYEVFQAAGASSTQFSKSNGLGDLELMCQAAPLEIGNYVWLDADADGVQDPSEAPLSGVRLQLWLDPDGTPGNGVDVLISTTQTDADGEYYFGVQPNSTYYVAIEPDQPVLSGLSLTSADYSANSGNTDAHDSDGVLNTATGKIIATVTTGRAGQNDYTYDFGFTPLGVIGNYVWLDENSDGYQDAGEPGIPNVTVILRDATNTPILTTTTDANGGYLFTDLPVGTYSVDIVDSSVPTGMSQTTLYTNGTGDFGNKDHSGNGYSVTIGNGNPLENLTADFGYNYNPTTDVNNPTGSPTAALGDRIWYDTDGDGVQDPEEVGIYNVCVELFSAGPDGVFGTSDDVSEGTTTTDYNGNYIFDGLTPGAYVVEVCSASLTGVLNGLNQTGDPDHFGSAETGAHYEDDHRTTSPVILGPGDVFLNVDFGYNGGTVGSVGDTIFIDYDADGNGPSLAPVDGGGAVTQGAGGSADATDSGIAGVTISLIRDLDGDGVWDTGEPIIATTITDANGQYLFGGLPLDDGGGDSDADYIIWVNDTDNVLNGLAQTYDSDGVLASPNQSAVALSSGAPDNRAQDFGYSPSSPLGSIGDTIWNDVDGNGASTPDDGEPGIPNVGIKLFADTNADGVADDINGDGVVNDSDALMTTTTDENGNYLFDGLPLDSYLVEVCDETLPAGFNTTPTYDPDGTTPINVGTTVTLTEANPANRDQDFSYTYTDTNLGSIGDQLWGDLDDGGESSPEAGDPPLAGVTVYLTSSSGYSATAVTDENGYYLFDNLPAGTYTITVDAGTIPDGFAATPSYDPQGVDDGVSVITLATDEHNRDQDFAYPPTGLSYTIGDTVWFDVDNSGGDQSTQAAEPGIAGVRVLLYNSSGTLVDSVYTDASGHYLFTGLSADTYTISIDTATLPPYVSIVSTYAGSDGSANDNASAVTVNAGNPHGRAEDFSYPPATALGTIGDTIWFDIDGGGTSTPDAGEPGLEGVVVLLTGEDGNTWTTLTDENGNYTFGNLPLGKTYTVTIPASNFASGGVLEGMSNTYDPDNDDDNAGVGVTLTSSNPVNLDQDFSYTGGAGQLGNLVWLGANADGDDDSGTAGSGEGPIANVTLALYRDLDCDGLVDAGEPLFGSTTTVGVVNASSYGTNGVYDFDGLPVAGAGTNSGSCWVVDVTDQANVLAGYWHSLGTQGADNHSQADPYGDSGAGELELTGASPVNLSADFGYYVDPAAVGNFVWFDLDYDGVQDSGEPGLDGITVTLVITYPDGTNVTLKTVTGDDPATSGTTEQGWYSFGNLLYDEDYATSSGAVAASSSPARPAHVLSMETPSGYSVTMVNAVAASGDQDDADDPTGVPTATTVGSQTTTQNSDPTAENNPIASYDFGITRIELGDLPNDKYNTFVANSGARHVIWPDWDGDNVPDLLGAIWSGVHVDVETEGHAGGQDGQTTGDDEDGVDDEDGLIIPPQTDLVVGNTVFFSVTLRSRGVQSADYGLWIDWNGDGDFTSENEFLSRNDIAIDQLVSGNIFQTTFVLSTTVPNGTVTHPTWIYIRGRAFAANTTTTRDVGIGAHAGLASNGEVEDFATRQISPTAVGLSSAETGSQSNTSRLAHLPLLLLVMLTVMMLHRQTKCDRRYDT